MEQEKAQRSVPPECTNVLDRVSRSLDNYLALEERTFAEWQSIDPDSIDSRSAKGKELGGP
jgi:hypothetical protein